MAPQGTKNAEMDLQTNTATNLNKLIDQTGIKNPKFFL